MPSARKTWHLLPHDREAITRLAAAVGGSMVVAQLVRNRGITDPAAAKRFLDASLSGLHPPQLLPGVPEAAERIAKAAADGRKICIFGDYDTDGVTGTAILVLLLAKLGADVQFHIPLRVGDGYGLNSEKLRKLSAAGVSLVVSVDCGITAVAEAEEARRLGLELIITDHHEFKAQLPNADVLVHPRLAGGAYPFDGLSGAGVALKLAWAIAQRVSRSEKVLPEFRELLLDAVGLAALGLVADVVPLLDENRILVRHGLHRIREKPSLGLSALIEAAGIAKNGEIRAEDVSFKLAPRINAAGRLDCAQLVVELLTTRNPERAKELAAYLETLNSQRQTLERRATKQAREILEAHAGEFPAGIVLGSREWHPGVIGIVAGRLAEQYGRPVLLAALRDGEPALGSGRSVLGFALHEALQACGEHLITHGGHAAAAGFKLEAEKFDLLRVAFDAEVRRTFPGGPPSPRLVLDAEVPLTALTTGLLREIDKLEPYGASNPRPKFLASDLTVVEGSAKPMGEGQHHLNFRVRQGSTKMRAVAFGMGDRLEELMSAGGACCLAFTPQLNVWEDRRNVEIHVLDLRAGRQAELV